MSSGEEYARYVAVRNGSLRQKQKAGDGDDNTEMKDLTETMRSAAMAIIALLEFNRTGQPAPVELRQSADDAAQDLLAMARHLATADAEAEGEETQKTGSCAVCI